MGNNKIIISPITEKDLEDTYLLGLNTPELQVGVEGPFMDKEEFIWSTNNPNGIFFVAKINDKIVGFIYANIRDTEKPMPERWACIIYLAVDKNYRRLGAATSLYDKCIKELKKQSITNVFVWANAESDGAIGEFMKRQGFAPGHKYMWMDKQI